MAWDIMVEGAIYSPYTLAIFAAFLGGLFTYFFNKYLEAQREDKRIGALIYEFKKNLALCNKLLTDYSEGDKHEYTVAKGIPMADFVLICLERTLADGLITDEKLVNNLQDIYLFFSENNNLIRRARANSIENRALGENKSIVESDIQRVIDSITKKENELTIIDQQNLLIKGLGNLRRGSKGNLPDLSPKEDFKSKFFSGAPLILFLLIVIFVTIFIVRGPDFSTINFFQGVIDLFTVLFAAFSTILFFLFFALTLEYSDKIGPFVNSRLKNIGNLQYLCTYLGLMIFYLFSYSLFSQFLVVELGVTEKALQYAILITFTYLFIFRVFHRKEMFGVKIGTILLTIAFLGFMKRLLYYPIPSFTSPNYEITNYLLFVPFVDLLITEMRILPRKINEWLNLSTKQ